MADYPDDAVVCPEWLCEALDEALGEPCSYDMAGRILNAISPLLDKHREQGKREGIAMAERAFKAAQYSPAPYIDGMANLRLLLAE